MGVVDPDVLKEALLLPPWLLVVALLLGVLLWLLGGWGHRFWIVMLTTLLSGVVGLIYGPQFGMQPLVAGLLVAVAAGALALALMRIGVFLAVGFAALGTARLVAPSWDEPLACFLVGGLFGIVLFRFWIVVLTSASGTLLMAHAGLALIGRFRATDVVGWSQQQAPLINWIIGATIVLGVLLQFLVQRRLKNKSGAKKKEEKAPPPEEQFEEAPPPPPPPPEKPKEAPPKRAGWWPWGGKAA
jgi:hypothetical protein